MSPQYLVRYGISNILGLPSLLVTNLAISGNRLWNCKRVTELSSAWRKVLAARIVRFFYWLTCSECPLSRTNVSLRMHPLLTLIVSTSMSNLHLSPCITSQMACRNGGSFRGRDITKMLSRRQVVWCRFRCVSMHWQEKYLIFVCQINTTHLDRIGVGSWVPGPLALFFFWLNVQWSV